jgi:hypothetical protein
VFNATREKAMWIVAIGWMYVVTLMAATETSVVAGVMTFLFYGMLPLSLVFYLTGAWRRGHAHKREAQQPTRGDSDPT